MTRTSRRRLLAGTLGSSLLAQVEPAPEVRLPRKVRLALAGFDGHPEEILRVLPQLPDVELVAVVTLLTGKAGAEVVRELPQQQSVFLDFLQSVYRGTKPALSWPEIVRANEATLAAHTAAEQHRFVAIPRV
jgi:hypothetical protein